MEFQSDHGGAAMIGVFQDDFGNAAGGGQDANRAVYNGQQCHPQGQARHQHPTPLPSMAMFPDQTQWNPYSNSVGQCWPQQDSSFAQMSGMTMGVKPQQQQQYVSSEYTAPVYAQLESCHMNNVSNNSSITSASPIQSPTSQCLPSSSTFPAAGVALVDESPMRPPSENFLPVSLSGLASNMPKKSKPSTGSKKLTNTLTKKALSKDKLKQITKITGIDRKEMAAMNARNNREKKKQKMEDMKDSLDNITATRDSLRKACVELNAKEKHVRARLEEVAKQRKYKILMVPQHMFQSDANYFGMNQLKM